MTEERIEHELDSIHRRLDAMQTRSTGERVWELVMKLTVPVAFIVGAAMVRNEVVDANQEKALEYQERSLRELRVGIKDDITELKVLLREINARVRSIEMRPRNPEKK